MMILRPLVPVLLGLLLLPGCEQSKPKVSFQVVTPAGQDPFAGVTTVRVSFGETTTETTLASASSPFTLSMELTPGTEGQVVLEGLDSGGDRVCRGATPAISATGLSAPVDVSECTTVTAS